MVLRHKGPDTAWGVFHSGGINHRRRLERDGKGLLKAKEELSLDSSLSFSVSV